MNYLAIINIAFIALFLMGAAFLWIQTKRLRDASSKATKSTNEESELAGEYSLLSIKVPKNNDKTPLAAEQMFAALHGIYRSDGGEQPQISFEMVSKNNAIRFYIHTPRRFREFVLSQVYAQYPTVEVEELDKDYAAGKEGASLAACELYFSKPRVYAIKTFQNFEVDPLSSITGVLSSAADNEEIWTQLIIRPIDDSWQEEGEALVSDVKNPKDSGRSFIKIAVDEFKLFIVGFMKSVVFGKDDEPQEKKSKDAPELSGPVQQALKGVEEKITKLGFEATIRVVALAADNYQAQAKLEQVVGAYKQFNSLNMNSFVSSVITDNYEAIDLYKSRIVGDAGLLLNVTELASLFHFPSESVSTPTIAWAGSRKGEPPPNLPLSGVVPADELTIFAQTNFRNQIRKFGIKRPDRRLHTYIIGKTGTGKSTLMENMIYDDIREGRGVAVVDPHGELIDHVLNFIPEDRLDDVVYFNPSDRDYPIGFNVLENPNPEMKNIIASGVVGIFKKIFGESWGPRLEYILRNAIIALLDSPNSTLLGVMRVLTDNAYRRKVISEIKDPVVRDFFLNEYERYDQKFRQEAIAPIQNKVGQFLSSEIIRNIIGQPKSTMDIRNIMDSGKILLADLSTGKIGEDNSALLGSMLITKIQLAAMSRTNIHEDERRDFYLYVDEFQNFATDSFATILSEARKYRLNLVMINQYTSQMPESVANAVFGNVGTMISFRVGASDAEVLQKEFEPVFDTNDLINLPNRQIYIKMAIDGVTVPAFSAGTLPPPAEKSNLKEQVVARSRASFAQSRSDVEDYITEWSMPIILSEEGSQPNKKDNKRDSHPEQGSSPQLKEIKQEKDPRAGESLEKALKKNKIEIIRDRFSRQWYAVTPNSQEKEQGSSHPLIGEDELETITDHKKKEESHHEPKKEIKPTSVEQGRGDRGEGEEESQLITWDQADELGLKLTNRAVKRPIDLDEFEPIDEIEN